MAVVVTKEIKRKRILLGVFGLLIVASLAIIYFGIFSKSSPAVSSQLPATATVTAVAPGGKVADLNVQVLEDSRFKELQPPPGVPVKTETTGKSNPFSD